MKGMLATKQQLSLGSVVIIFDIWNRGGPMNIPKVVSAGKLGPRRWQRGKMEKESLIEVLSVSSSTVIAKEVHWEDKV